MVWPGEIIIFAEIVGSWALLLASYWGMSWRACDLKKEVCVSIATCCIEVFMVLEEQITVSKCCTAYWQKQEK